MYEYRATVTSVYDGDTITVDIDLGFNVQLKNQKIRLANIDTPEVKGAEREQGLVVRDKLRELIGGKAIILKTEKDKQGSFGRWLGTVILDRLNINQYLLDNELAKPYQ